MRVILQMHTSRDAGQSSQPADFCPALCGAEAVQSVDHLICHCSHLNDARNSLASSVRFALVHGSPACTQLLFHSWFVPTPSKPKFCTLGTGALLPIRPLIAAQTQPLGSCRSEWILRRCHVGGSHAVMLLRNPMAAVVIQAIVMDFSSWFSLHLARGMRIVLCKCSFAFVAFLKCSPSSLFVCLFVCLCRLGSLGCAS